MGTVAQDPKQVRIARASRTRLTGDPVWDTFHFGPPQEQALYRAHRERMAAWGLPIGNEYEDEVVQRALGALRGTDSEPVSHPHAHEEMGMCVECDAAAILSVVR